MFDRSLPATATRDSAGNSGGLTVIITVVVRLETRSITPHFPGRSTNVGDVFVTQLLTTAPDDDTRLAYGRRNSCRISSRVMRATWRAMKLRSELGVAYPRTHVTPAGRRRRRSYGLMLNLTFINACARSSEREHRTTLLEHVCHRKVCQTM